MRPTTKIYIVLISLLWLWITPSASSQTYPFLKLTVTDLDNISRITLESNRPLLSSVEKNAADLVIRIRSQQPYRIQKSSFDSVNIASVGWSRGADFYMFNVKMKAAEYSVASSRYDDPPRLVIDVIPAGASIPDEPPASSEEADAEEIRNGGNRDDSSRPSLPPAVLQQQDMKTIVIDPGHGGLETGAKGKFGTLEKDITLPISLELKSLIERNLAFRVVLTRDRDIDVSLDNRAALANNNRAFVFISIHANGYRGRGVRGAETYFLSLNATDEEARRLAYMENNSSELEQIPPDSQDDIKMILWDMAQAAYLKQSYELAQLIQNELNRLPGGTLNRGIKQAPFKVLTGVACPAVLVEVAFISNPDEERSLLREDFRREVATAIYRGLTRYLKQNSR